MAKTQDKTLVPHNGGAKKGLRFDRVASFYEWASAVYSIGQIAASKRWQVTKMDPGQRVLYVGVGGGEDAIVAARHGVELTCLDLSQRMLDRCARKLQSERLTAELRCEDVSLHQRTTYYDVVAANFFLNCFDQETMPQIMEQLVRLLVPTGRLMIADVAPPEGNRFARWCHELHHAAAIRSFHAMGLVPLHPIYDYEPYLPSLGMAVVERAKFRLTRWGPVAYQSIVCQAMAAEATTASAA